MKKLPWGNKIFICILMLMVVINGKYCFNNPTKSLAYSNSILSFICWVVFSYGTCKLVETAAWKRIKEFLNIGFGFGGCFAGAMIVGVQLDNYGRIEFSSNSIWLLLGWAVLAVGCAPIWAGCIYKLSNLKKDGEVQLPEGEQKLMSWKIVGILMVSYLLVLLAVWPGFFSYDAEAESYMVFTDKYSAHHPIVHVLLLGWIMKVMYKIIPSYNAGIVAYLLLQMLVISCCFSYMICFLKRIGVRRWIINISLIFLSLFPTVSMFVCCTTKDVYFSGGLTLLTTLLLEIAKDESAFWQDQRKKWLFAIAIMLVLLFRNNGIYAFVVFLPIFVWIFRKCWRKWLPVLIGIFSFYIVLNQGMNAVFDVKPGEKAEMLCVPMQQLARIHNEDKECFTEEDLEVMYTLIPEVILNNYNPKLADNVKVNFMEDNFKANPAKYISLWIRMGLKRPDIYVNSFLMNTYGYWYPDTVIDGYAGKWNVDREYEESSYFAFTTEMPGVRKSLIPVLEQFYEKISLEIYQQQLPVVSMLFSVGFWHWVFLFVVMYLCAIKYKKQAVALSVMGLVYLTMLLGPIALVRYVLYWFFSAPLFLALLFDTVAFSEKRIEVVVCDERTFGRINEGDTGGTAAFVGRSAD